jgi:hypothetical protein
MKNKDLLLILLNLLIGSLTLIFMNILPVAGGGSSLIFVITVPVSVGVAFLSSLAYYFLSKRNKDHLKYFVIAISIIINLFISLAMFPYGS